MERNLSRFITHCYSGHQGHRSDDKHGCVKLTPNECASAWYADGRGFDPHVRQNILSLRFGHENNSTAILSLPLIQEGQLSVTGERMGTKNW